MDMPEQVESQWTKMYRNENSYNQQEEEYEPPSSYSSDEMDDEMSVEDPMELCTLNMEKQRQELLQCALNNVDELKSYTEKSTAWVNVEHKANEIRYVLKCVASLKSFRRKSREVLPVQRNESYSAVRNKLFAYSPKVKKPVGRPEMCRAKRVEANREKKLWKKDEERLVKEKERMVLEQDRQRAVEEQRMRRLEWRKELNLKLKRLGGKNKQRRMKEVFKKWRNWYDTSILDRVNLLEKNRLLRGVLSSWETVILRAKRRRVKAEAAQRWKLFTVTFRDWKLNTHKWIAAREIKWTNEHRQIMAAQEAAAIQCFQNKLLRNMVLQWRIWVNNRKDVQHITVQHAHRKQKALSFLDRLADAKATLSAPNEDKVVEQKVQVSKDVQMQDNFNVEPHVSLHADAKTTISVEDTIPSDEKNISVRKPRKTSIPESKQVLAMRQRELVRKQRREALKQKYVANDLEKQRRAEEQAAMEQQAIQDKKHETKRILMLEKRLVAQKQAEKHLQQETMRQKLLLAKLHYLGSIVLHYGWSPWRRYLKHQRLAMQKAARWHADLTLLNVLHIWGKFTKTSVLDKKQLESDKYHQATLYSHRQHVLHFYTKWIFHHNMMQAKLRKSKIHHCTILKFQLFSKLKQYHQHCILQWRKKMKTSIAHYEYQLQNRIFKKWQSARKNLQFENELEFEKQLAWQQVHEWLNETKIKQG